jgi:hypothetical protein
VAAYGEHDMAVVRGGSITAVSNGSRRSGALPARPGCDRPGDAPRPHRPAEIGGPQGLAPGTPGTIPSSTTCGGRGMTDCVIAPRLSIMRSKPYAWAVDGGGRCSRGGRCVWRAFP